jgi:hypothetical protein
MKGQWIIKEVYFEDGWPSVIRDPKFNEVEMKRVLQQALSALDSAYYILKIQPVTPEQEANTVALAIQSVTEELEKLG